MSSVDVGRWTKNYEINALKDQNGRWRYRHIDIRDFAFRYKNDMLHNYNSKFDNRTRINVSKEILRDFFIEEHTFQKIVCILVTLEPYALFNDPERRYDDSGFSEGGITFKDAMVRFCTMSLALKDAELSFRQQRQLYPTLVAKVINQLGDKYLKRKSGSIEDRILAAGWELVNERISYNSFVEEIQNDVFFKGWSGLDSYLHNELKPMSYPKKELVADMELGM